MNPIPQGGPTDCENIDPFFDATKIVQSDDCEGLSRLNALICSNDDDVFHRSTPPPPAAGDGCNKRSHFTRRRHTRYNFLRLPKT